MLQRQLCALLYPRMIALYLKVKSSNETMKQIKIWFIIVISSL